MTAKNSELPKIEQSKYEISVFTCTYNRATTLRRTYDSLCKQTVRNFEWIVYDNGSTDNSRKLIDQWITQADFPITVLSRKDNSGFQRTYNFGIQAANGFFWLVLDSDDELVPDALDKMIKIWREIPSDERPKFTGVTVNCVDQHGNLVGEEFPTSPLDSDSLELFYKHKVRSEKFGMHRLDVLRRYSFPDVDGHVNPSIVWRSIAETYKTRFSNEALRIYYIEESGREDQITFHTALDTNAYGRRMNHMHSLNNHLSWFRQDPLQFLKHAGVYSLCSQTLSVGSVKALADIKPPFGKLLVLATYPAAKILIAMNQLKKLKTRRAEAVRG